MRYLSVCSGIEAASAAWMPLGWRPVAFSEIEPFPTSVLAHHHPGVPNWGDMTKYKEWPDEPIDLLCGGTPCQSFSVAGLRKGLDDPRGNLMLTFGAIAARYRPRWLVWENVPGVLSSNGGRDFGTFLGMLGQLGYGFAYRVLDAQYVRVESHPRAVPQRRRRVFVVGHSGGQWHRAAAVLFERASLCGHPAPSREAGQVAPTIPSRSTAGGGLGTDFDCDGGLIQAYGGNNQSGPIDVATARNACASASGRMDFETETFLVQPAHTLRGEGFDASEDGTGRGTPLVPVTTPTLTSNGDAHSGFRDEHGLVPVAFDTTQITSAANRSNPQPGDACHPLAAGAHAPAIAFAIQAGALRVNPASGPDGVGVDASEDGTGLGQPILAFNSRQDPVSGNVFGALDTCSPQAQAVAVSLRGRDGGATAELGDEVGNCLRASSGGGDKPYVLTSGVTIHGTDKTASVMSFTDICGSLRTKPPGSIENSSTTAVYQNMAVRRLTPRECERLQGFPDGYTNVPHRGKPVADGPRYKALGNSWAVNCARWIGERIEAVEAIAQQKVEAA